MRRTLLGEPRLRVSPRPIYRIVPGIVVALAATRSRTTAVPDVLDVPSVFYRGNSDPQNMEWDEVLGQLGQLGQVRRRAL